MDAAIDRHTSKLSTALGISDSECDNIYGTVNGAYQTWSGFSKERGDIFYVTDHTSNIYKNSPGARVVHNLETIAAGHVYNGVAMAGYIYARMLQYAGVNVDPTNPETYMNKYNGSNGKQPEWVANFTEDHLDLLRANGLTDESKMDSNHARVLEAAVNLFGIPYSMALRGGFDDLTKRPEYLDCSSYVWRAYADAGFDMTNFPQGSGAYPGNTRVIDYSEMIPGDILRMNGHVMIYLGQDDARLYVLETNTQPYLSRANSHPIGYLNQFKAYRYKGFD